MSDVASVEEGRAFFVGTDGDRLRLSGGVRVRTGLDVRVTGGLRSSVGGGEGVKSNDVPMNSFRVEWRTEFGFLRRFECPVSFSSFSLLCSIH